MLRSGPNATGSSSSSSSSNVSARHPYIHQRSYSTPIDNVPFTASHAPTDSINTNVEVAKYTETIDRIGHFLSTPSQSEYNFSLENTIISESLLSWSSYHSLPNCDGAHVELYITYMLDISLLFIMMVASASCCSYYPHYDTRIENNTSKKNILSLNITSY